MLRAYANSDDTADGLLQPRYAHRNAEWQGSLHRSLLAKDVLEAFMREDLHELGDVRGEFAAALHPDER